MPECRGEMEGSIVWKAEVIPNHISTTSIASTASTVLDKASQIILPRTSIPSSLSVPRKRMIQILLSVDFDAVSDSSEQVLTLTITWLTTLLDTSQGMWASLVSSDYFENMLSLHLLHGSFLVTLWKASQRDEDDRG